VPHVEVHLPGALKALPATVPPGRATTPQGGRFKKQMYASRSDLSPQKMCMHDA
jgi:hypothetical protein